MSYEFQKECFNNSCIGWYFTHDALTHGGSSAHFVILTLLLAAQGLSAEFGLTLDYSFLCTFKSSLGISDTYGTEMPGTVAGGDRNRVSCPVPEFTSPISGVEVSLSYLDGRGKTTVPFTGVAGRATIGFRAGWIKAVVSPALTVRVETFGFPRSGKVTCGFSVKGGTAPEQSRAVPIALSGPEQWLDCGAAPDAEVFYDGTGYAEAVVSLTGLDSGEYAFAGTAGDDIVRIPLDNNGKKDGKETDIDCGGPEAKNRCGVLKQCLRDTDCQDGIPCTDNEEKPGTKFCAGITGKEQSCAEILYKYTNYYKKRVSSGTYDIYVGKSPHMEKETAQGKTIKVFCDMETDEGGWTLVATFTGEEGYCMWDKRDSGDVGYRAGHDGSALANKNSMHEPLLLLPTSTLPSACALSTSG